MAVDANVRRAMVLAAAGARAIDGVVRRSALGCGSQVDVRKEWGCQPAAKE